MPESDDFEPQTVFEATNYLATQIERLPKKRFMWKAMTTIARVLNLLYKKRIPLKIPAIEAVIRIMKLLETAL